jgi:hypothetical protein
MPGIQPRETKRKARANLGESKSNSSVKLQRTTLDAFFAPRQTISGSSVAKEENAPASLPSCEAATRPRSTESGDVGLSAEQEKVLRMVVDDERNIFFTGSAG